MPYTLNIRNRRQITLPAEVLERLQLEVGDKLVVEVGKQKITAKPLKRQTLNSLEAIQKAFEKAKISEEELQRSGREIRKELFKKQYGKRL